MRPQFFENKCDVIALLGCSRERAGEIVEEWRHGGRDVGEEILRIAAEQNDAEDAAWDLLDARLCP